MTQTETNLAVVREKLRRAQDSYAGSYSIGMRDKDAVKFLAMRAFDAAWTAWQIAQTIFDKGEFGWKMRAGSEAELFHPLEQVERILDACAARVAELEGETALVPKSAVKIEEDERTKG